MAEETVPAMLAPPVVRSWRDHPLLRSRVGVAGLIFLVGMLGVCVLTLPWTLAAPSGDGAAGGGGGGRVPRYSAGEATHARLAPSWWPRAWWAGWDAERARLNGLVDGEVVEEVAGRFGVGAEALVSPGGFTDPEVRRAARGLEAHWPGYALGTDVLGRSLGVRVLTGGGISLGIGLAAAGLSVLIGTLYGAIAGYAGGRVDAVMMRVVDVLYGLPYILLVVLLAVAVDAWVEESIANRVERVSEQRARWVEQQTAARGIASGGDGSPAEESVRALEREALERFGSGELSSGTLSFINVVTLLVAIGGVSWLTMSRVIRGQVLSLKAQPFVEAARAAGAPAWRIFGRHLLPNLLGPIIVYATLTVPQAILQESFLSFLGIGVKPPLPSWGNLAAEGLAELNTYRSNWWLLVFPCVLLGSTLLAMNFVGEGLREAFDPKRRGR